MITRLFRRINLKIHPLKKGDVLYGDCAEWNMTLFNQFKYGLRSQEGDLLFTYWHGENTFRLTITNASMPYYVFDSEVLSRNMDEGGQFVWAKRNTPNRRNKAILEGMILTGKLTRSKT